MASTTTSLPLGYKIPALRLPPVLRTILYIPLIIAVALLGDFIAHQARPAFIPNFLWRPTDSMAHAAVAIMVAAPLLGRAPLGQRFTRLASTVVAAVFIDLDHFWVAGSMLLEQATGLPGGRPVSHSFLFITLFSLLILLLTRRPMNSWIVFSALASHILRDAFDGWTPLLFPFYFERLSAPSYFIGLAGLYLASLGIARFRLAKRPALSSASLPTPSLGD